jgi:hypothetical protein
MSKYGRKRRAIPTRGLRVSKVIDDFFIILLISFPRPPAVVYRSAFPQSLCAIFAGHRRVIGDVDRRFPF